MKSRMILAAAMMASVLLAQGPGGRGPGRFGGPGGPDGPMAAGMAGRGAGFGNADALKTTLGLTDTQVQQLRDLRKQQAAAAQPTMDQIRTKRQALAEALKSSSPDPAAVGQLTVDIRKLADSMKSARADREVQALALLTPDQKAKVAALQEAQKLMPAVAQATALGLLAPLQPPADGANAAISKRGAARAGRAPRQ